MRELLDNFKVEANLLNTASRCENSAAAVLLMERNFPYDGTNKLQAIKNRRLYKLLQSYEQGSLRDLATTCDQPKLTFNYEVKLLSKGSAPKGELTYVKQLRQLVLFKKQLNEV